MQLKENVLPQKRKQCNPKSKQHMGKERIGVTTRFFSVCHKEQINPSSVCKEKKKCRLLFLPLHSEQQHMTDVHLNCIMDDFILTIFPIEKRNRHCSLTFSSCMVFSYCLDKSFKMQGASLYSLTACPPLIVLKKKSSCYSHYDMITIFSQSIDIF